MAALPLPGTLFASKYVIESQIGGGAAGVVLSAMHQDLRQRVAIKVLREAGAVASERMLREARAAITLQSEHVVRVMDVGRDADQRVFLVMEQLEGSDLASLLKKRGPLPVEEAVDYVLQACAGVAEAHARGVVHRDLKPSNLFLARRADGGPLVKVLDFGISKSTSGEDAETSLTGSAEVLGSPMYMSPEQVRGAKLVDHRTDIWALGVIVFRLVSGKAPFGAGMTVGAALASVVADEPVALREVLPQAPRALEAIVRRCLNKAQDERFGSVAELAAALAPFGTDDGRAAVIRLVRDQVRAPAARKRWPLWAASAVVVLAVPAVALAVHQRGKAAAAPALVADTSTASSLLSASTLPSASALPSPPALPAAPALPSTSTLATAPALSAASAHALGPAALSPRRAPPRPRPSPNSSVVRSAATDDRY